MHPFNNLWIYLNITFADFVHSREDENDHIDSDTPRSGLATPQPDPSDKRTPGIIHSFFGQVGDGFSSFKNPSLHNNYPPESEAEDHFPSLPQNSNINNTSLKAASTSSHEHGKGVQEENSTPLLQLHEPSGTSQSPAQHPYPTPPVSHPPSLHKLKLSDENSEDGCNEQKEAASLDRDCISESFPSHARRGSTMTPLSSIVTPSNVHACDFSNPSDPSSEHLSSTPNSEFHKSPSYDRLRKLTCDAQKSTPSTPTRALSIQTAQSDTSATSTGSDQNTKQNGKSSTGESSNSSKSDGVAPSVGTTKGKLTVKILEGRGLKKSVDPYVVVVFQRNELVSKGPHSDDGEDNDDISHSPVGGIPITRTASDSGRPMAIPMKSRQSSNTSLSEYRDFKNKGRKLFTNPKWDTDAVFDVVGPDSRVNVTVYDRAQQAEEFLGHVDLEANLVENDGMQANFAGFTFVDESSIEENMRDRVRESYDEMDHETSTKGPNDWEDPFDVPDKSRADRMSGIVRTTTNEDERMFNGDHFEV
ncbi:agc akt kinase protein [Rutstroemia sp. NJR-2017a WRK4]|nr:agc akt kinase protein [Rutstroemia sp. NJR-2017a WRK4]PQE14753.1 agc akt kinase protein [Rutstroemia sp. NJR-2017a WRK4]